MINTPDFVKINRLLNKRISKRAEKLLPKIEDRENVEEIDPPPIQVSKEKLKELKKDMEKLKGRREELNEAWRLAVEEGDDRETDALSVTLQLLEENELETRKQENLLSRATLLVDQEECDIVNLGSRIKVRNITFNIEQDIILVDPIEAQPASGKFSYESPIGNSLLDRSVGDKVSYRSPDGKNIELEIIEIE